jgi:hypothetical protein
VTHGGNPWNRIVVFPTGDFQSRGAQVQYHLNPIVRYGVLYLEARLQWARMIVL